MVGIGGKAGRCVHVGGGVVVECEQCVSSQAFFVRVAEGRLWRKREGKGEKGRLGEEKKGKREERKKKEGEEGKGKAGEKKVDEEE